MILDQYGTPIRETEFLTPAWITKEALRMSMRDACDQRVYELRQSIVGPDSHSGQTIRVRRPLRFSAGA